MNTPKNTWSDSDSCPSLAPSLAASVGRSQPFATSLTALDLSLQTLPAPPRAPPLVGPRYKGLTGKESLPNVDFWTSLPSLVKEGVGFTVAKVKEKTSGGSAGYSAM